VFFYRNVNYVCMMHMEKIKVAARMLNISERFLRQLIAQARVPYYRLSERTIRVDVQELRNYMRLIAEGSPVVVEEDGK